MVMGHVLNGSREIAVHMHFGKRDVEWFIEQYQKINSGMEDIESEAAKLGVRIDELEKTREMREALMHQDIEKLKLK